MKTLEIIVSGKVVGKGRPRFARLKNGRMVAYTPGATRAWESIVRSAAEDAMGRAGFDERFESPVSVQISIVCEVPRSWPAWKRDAALQGKICATTRPDSDNAIKLIFDSCNGVVWRDDAQIVDMSINKYFGPAARMRIVVHVLDSLLPAQITKRPKSDETTCGHHQRYLPGTTETTASVSPSTDSTEESPAHGSGIAKAARGAQASART